jgi:hypothetical protein
MKATTFQKRVPAGISFLIVAGFAVATCVGLVLLSKSASGWQVGLAAAAGLVFVVLLAACGIHTVRREGTSIRTMAGALAFGCLALILSHWLPLAGCGGVFVPFGLGGCITIWARGIHT